MSEISGIESAPGVSEAVLARMDMINAHHEGETDWLTPWTPVLLDTAAVDWLRFGRRVDDNKPGFAQIISLSDEPTSYQTWRGLVDEDQLQTLMNRLPTS